MSQHEQDVATWAAVAGLGLMSRHELDVATWVAVARLGLRSQHHFDIATQTAVWAEKRCRDTDLMSRHGVVWVVSRHRFDVAT